MNRIVGDLSYDLNKILGQGSFGTLVFSGFHILGGKPVAVKRVQRSFLKNEDLLHQEVELMQKASNHPNILCFISTEINDDYLYLYMQNSITNKTHLQVYMVTCIC